MSNLWRCQDIDQVLLHGDHFFISTFSSSEVLGKNVSVRSKLLTAAFWSRKKRTEGVKPACFMSKATSVPNANHPQYASPVEAFNLIVESKFLPTEGFADKSPTGWTAVVEYESGDLADDSEDEKGLRSAERRALSKLRSPKQNRSTFQIRFKFSQDPSYAAGNYRSAGQSSAIPSAVLSRSSAISEQTTSALR